MQSLPTPLVRFRMLLVAAVALWSLFALFLLHIVVNYRPGVPLLVGVLGVVALGVSIVLVLILVYVHRNLTSRVLHSSRLLKVHLDDRLRTQEERLRQAITQSTSETLDSVKAITQNEGLQTRRQLEGALSLYATLPLSFPLDPMQDWAVHGDTAAYLVRLIGTRNPRKVVELGSGVSTLIIAAALKKLQAGSLFYSIEHDCDFVHETQEALRRENLLELVNIVYAPLVNVQINEKSYRWYQPSAFSDIKDIDLLVIDGPPGHTDHTARYPALPLLRPRLSENAIVLLDDANRQWEREILNRWRSEYPAFSWTLPWANGKGLAVGRCHQAAGQQSGEGGAVNART